MVRIVAEFFSLRMSTTRALTVSRIARISLAFSSLRIVPTDAVISSILGLTNSRVSETLDMTSLAAASRSPGSLPVISSSGSRIFDESPALMLTTSAARKVGAVVSATALSGIGQPSSTQISTR